MAIGPREAELRRQREAAARSGGVQTISRPKRAVAQADGAKVPPRKPPVVAAAAPSEEDPLMSPVLIAFTQGQKRWLDDQARERKCGRSDVVRQAVKEAMLSKGSGNE